MYRIQIDTELEAVVFGRIMAGRHHNFPLKIQVIDGEGEYGGRTRADIGHIASGCPQSFDHFIRIAIRRDPAVTAYRQPCATTCLEECTDAFPDVDHIAVGDILTNDAPNVIFPENLIVHVFSLQIPAQCHRTQQPTVWGKEMQFPILYDAQQ